MRDVGQRLVEPIPISHCDVVENRIAKKIDSELDNRRGVRPTFRLVHALFARWRQVQFECLRQLQTGRLGRRHQGRGGRLDAGIGGNRGGEACDVLADLRLDDGVDGLMDRIRQPNGGRRRRNGQGGHCGNGRPALRRSRRRVRPAALVVMLSA